MMNPVDIAQLSPHDRQHLLRLLGRKLHPGSVLVAEGLVRSGIKRLCGIGGTPVDAVFAEAARRGVRVISPRHQTTAALMAAASNYLTGALESAVLVSAGPAITNAMTGVLVARDNHWPLLMMGGRRPLKGEGAGYFQEMDAVPLMRPLCKWAATVPSADEIVPMITEAAGRAVSGIPGPVYLDLPEDVISATASISGTQAPFRIPLAPPPAEHVDRSLTMLRESERPLLCLGEGIRWTVDSAALQRFVERERIPFISTSLARGFLPDDHPLCFNTVRHRVPIEADLVLMAGAWFDWRFRLGVEFDPEARFVHADPDRETLGRNVPLALGIQCDPGLFLNELAHRSESKPGAVRPAWPNGLVRLREIEAEHQASWRTQSTEPMLPSQLYDVLADLLPDDALVVLEGSVHLACGQHLLRVNKPLSWLDPSWSGCIGSGLAFGLGARLAFPDRPIAVVIGDTGMGMSGMELETAVRNELPVLLIVVNNDGVNGRVRQDSYLSSTRENPFFVFSPGLRYDVVARGLGVDSAYWIESVSELRTAVGEALKSRRTTCLNVRVNPGAAIPPVW